MKKTLLFLLLCFLTIPSFAQLNLKKSHPQFTCGEKVFTGDKGDYCTEIFGNPKTRFGAEFSIWDTEEAWITYCFFKTNKERIEERYDVALVFHDCKMGNYFCFYVYDRKAYERIQNEKYMAEKRKIESKLNNYTSSPVYKMLNAF